MTKHHLLLRVLRDQRRAATIRGDNEASALLEGQRLSIAYGGVVKKHGLPLGFETEVGNGTALVIRLPHQRSGGGPNVGKGPIAFARLPRAHSPLGNPFNFYVLRGTVHTLLKPGPGTTCGTKRGPS